MSIFNKPEPLGIDDICSQVEQMVNEGHPIIRIPAGYAVVLTGAARASQTPAPEGFDAEEVAQKLRSDLLSVPTLLEPIYEVAVGLKARAEAAGIPEEMATAIMADWIQRATSGVMEHVL